MLYSEIKDKLIYDQSYADSETRIQPGTRCSHISIIKYIGYTERYFKGGDGILKTVKEHYYLCNCDCGNLAELAYPERTLKQARDGRFTLSCGCMQQKHYEFLRESENHYKKKYKYNSRSHIGELWSSMKAKCYNKNDSLYNTAGALGITVCDEWLDNEKGLDNFGDWIISAGYDLYSDRKVFLTRIDKTKEFSPSNCILSYKQDTNNIYLEWYGFNYSMVELANKFGMLPASLRVKLFVQEYSLYDALMVRRRFRTKADRQLYIMENYPKTNRFPYKAFKKLPFDMVDFADIDPRDPRRFYEYPNKEFTLRTIALQARLKARDEGHPVKPFEFTNSNSDDFLGYNQYMERTY